MNAIERLRAVVDFDWVPGSREEHADVIEALAAVDDLYQAAKERPCNRFDITPCSERPEIDEADWCAMCVALARADGDD